MGVVLDGCPAGLATSEKEIQADLDRRIPRGTSTVSSRIESDKVEILSGLFEGHTTGAPICMIVQNRDVDDATYLDTRYKPRPGHADLTSSKRYGGYQDYRGGGIFSGRSTVSFVLAGAIARTLLRRLGIEVLAHAIEIAGVRTDSTTSLDDVRGLTYDNPVRCANLSVARMMEAAILEAAAQGDSVGGVVEGMALGVPVGVGEPLYDSLDADLAKLLFNIPAVKGVEFGAGFESARMKGSTSNDEYLVRSGEIEMSTNNAGGITGGLSTGQPLKIRVAFKPTSSIAKSQNTVNLKTMREDTIQVMGRHDPCVVPKAVPVVEAVISIVLVDHLIRAGKIPKVLGRRSHD